MEIGRVRNPAYRAFVDNPEAMAKDRNKHKKYRYNSAESSNEQKDKIGIKWYHITQSPTPASSGRGYSPLRITKGRPNFDLPNDTALPDKVNAFYACIDNNSMLGVSAVTDPDDLVISLFEAKMKKIFKSGQPTQGRGAVLRGYAEQLQNNLSLSQSVIPTCLR